MNNGRNRFGDAFVRSLKFSSRVYNPSDDTVYSSIVPFRVFSTVLLLEFSLGQALVKTLVKSTGAKIQYFQ